MWKKYDLKSASLFNESLTDQPWVEDCCICLRFWICILFSHLLGYLEKLVLVVLVKEILVYITYVWIFITALLMIFDSVDATNTFSCVILAVKKWNKIADTNQSRQVWATRVTEINILMYPSYFIFIHILYFFYFSFKILLCYTG